MVQKLEKADYRELKKFLGRGAMKQIHHLFNEKMKELGKPSVSYYLVSMVLRGVHYRQDVLDFAIEYAQKMKAEKKSLMMLTSNKIKELVEK